MVEKTACKMKCGVVFWLRMMIIMTITQIHLCQSKATLEDYGYKGITIVIEPDVPEDEVLLKKLEESLTEASKVLFRATRRLAYFEEFIIVLPDTWTRKPHYGNADNYGNTQEKIVISSTKSEYGDAPYVKQPEGCGKPGLFMHLTPSYITNDTVSYKWGPRGQTIVHEWGHLRWGLFDEYSIKSEKTRKENGNIARCPQDAKSDEELIEISPGVFITKAVPVKNSSQMVSFMYTHYMRDRWTSEAKLLATELGLTGDKLVKFIAAELRGRRQEERERKKEEEERNRKFQLEEEEIKERKRERERKLQLEEKREKETSVGTKELRLEEEREKGNLG
ncbi:hypothetical protein C0Q70_14754 [Pomacea canaliculata]|uniref:Calcium-activated chloride channel N-terminal domain-containing protein n=1 Tax=Pomacea canaliculata TaxID=400727 RepID=A0A2T7NT03_POMCA|nr:hypothetical protein C0Q70_14754 [Pomacea canaliculata]